MNELNRYSVIHEKNPREIVLLRGNGCKWRKCTFCDYHLDFSLDEEANYELNKSVLRKVTGIYGELEIIDSGSMADLDEKTIALIKETCLAKNIHTVHIESHWIHREQITQAKEDFAVIGIKLVRKTGLESFDYDYRENVLLKGVDEKDPAVIASYFEEANFMQGIKGQTIEMMKNDIELGLKYFDRICLNVMTENSTRVKPDKELIARLVAEVYPAYADNDRVDILLNNTDFGVG